ELAPYRADAPERIAAAGPDVSLEPRTAQTLALALHELSTNAAKYGSLSVMSGRVEVNWELQPRNLLLRWTESGGARPPAPAPPGVGHPVDRPHRRRPPPGGGRVPLPPAGPHPRPPPAPRGRAPAPAAPSPPP